MLKGAVKPLSITEFVQMIEEIPGFSFARYGDGTFFSMQGYKGENCDGVKYTSEQASSLFSTLQDTTIYHALGNLALSTANAETWLAEKQIDLEWYDANVMHNASETGKLFSFIEFLRKRKIIFCGPEHLRKFQGFPIKRFVECHATKAFEEIDALDLEIGYQLMLHRADTVLISAGFAAPSLVSRLHQQYPDVVFLDTGSVWDPYCGIFSRRPHRKRGWIGTVALGKVNLHMDIRGW